MTKKHRVSIIVMLSVIMLSVFVGQRAVAQNRNRKTVKTVKYVKKPVRIRPSGKPYTGYHKQPAGKPVDLGLGVLWADRNVGSASPSDDGGVFLWGSVTGMLGKMAEAEKKPDIPEIFNSTYDTAHMCWGGDWRMPSRDDFIELFTKCKVTLVKDADGWESILKFTGPNGNSILLPMTGEVRNSYDSEPYRYKWPDGNYWIGETNRDGIEWSDRKFYNIDTNFSPSLAKINQPFCAHIDLLITYNRSTGKVDPASFSIYSLSDYSSIAQFKCAMAVRPVMDRNGLPTGNTADTADTDNPTDTSKEAAPAHKNASPHPAGKANKGNGTSRQSTGPGKPRNSNRGGAPANSKAPNSGGGKGDAGKGAKQTGGTTPPTAADINQADGTQNDTPPMPTPNPTPNPFPLTHNEPVAVERAVDLGLSVYWSDRNVGAGSTTDPGQYFFWGDKEPKELEKQKVSVKDIPLCVGNINGTENDIATQKWGDRWRMPTKEEIEELIANCTFRLDCVDGQRGIKVTGKTKKSIFIPFGGGYDPYQGRMLLDNCAVIWSGTECPAESGSEIPINAYGGVFLLPGGSNLMNIPKCLLANVRPVTKTLLVNHRDPHPCHNP